MAFNDTLFQLGMDLTRSSTTQAEDLVAPRVNAKGDRKDSFQGSESSRYAGKHLLIDVFGAKRLDDMAYVEKTLKRCVKAAGATLLHVHLHNTAPSGGVTGVAVLAESHISVHSWPEVGFAAFDVFMSGSARPEACVSVLRDAFAATDVVVKEHRRGEDIEQLQANAAPMARRVRSQARTRARAAA
jgi:S-adenosylmethionine decarboxylase